MNRKRLLQSEIQSDFQASYHDTQKVKKIQRWKRKGYLLPNGRPFKNEQEMQLFLDAIRLYDPTLAQIFWMSYKYCAHPIYGTALILFNNRDFFIGGVSNKFPITNLSLDKEDLNWFINYNHNVNDLEPLLLFTNPKNVFDEISMRWDKTFMKLKNSIQGVNDISIGSFLFTKFHEIFSEEMDVYDFSKKTNIPNINILDLLLESTGIHLSEVIIGSEQYTPPDPFEGYDHLRPELG